LTAPAQTLAYIATISGREERSVPATPAAIAASAASRRADVWWRVQRADQQRRYSVAVGAQVFVVEPNGGAFANASDGLRPDVA